MTHEDFIDSRLQAKLHRLALHYLQNEMDAEDAVQDAICNLWSDRVPVTSDEAHFRLFAILKNVCRNMLKRKRNFVDLNENDRAASTPDYDESDKLKELLLASLSPLQKEVFELATFEELDYEAIAQRLDMSVDAVRMNMSRARRKLRELYKKL